MNWLAHLALSPDDPENRLGNWLADVISAHDASALSPGIARGVALHRLIDGFTDRHPAHLRSRRRFPTGLRIFGGIIADVLYDHFLSLEFTARTGLVLADFTAKVYLEFTGQAQLLPAAARQALKQMIAQDWLSCYGSLDGVELTLRRVSHRLSPRAAARFDPAAACRVIAGSYEAFQGDYEEFFPDLQVAVKQG